MNCRIYIWAAASETEYCYTVSHMVTLWQRPCSPQSLVWTNSVGRKYSVSKKKNYELWEGSNWLLKEEKLRNQAFSMFVNIIFLLKSLHWIHIINYLYN